MISRSHPHEDVLLNVARPQQYTGGEWNLLPSLEGKPRITLIYPDTYELGMSNFGLTVLRHVLLASSEFDVRRAFSPAPDMDDLLESEKLPFVDLEMGEPVSDSAVIGFGVPSESLFTNVLHLVGRMGLKVRSEDRGEMTPIVIAGGGGIANPLPLAPFVDVFFLGECEEQAVPLFRILTGTGNRNHRLKRAHELPGVFVPSMGKSNVEMQRVGKLSSEWAPVNQLVPVSKVSQDRAVVEIARGCTRGCRFCQASQLNRPVRERSVDDVVRIMDQILSSTGWEKAGLLTLSLSDYSHLSLLLPELEAVAASHHAALGRPSLRPDTFCRLESGSNIQGRITIAPEAGSEELRMRINKPMSDEKILEAANLAFGMGAKGIKLYFMVGLPEETLDDVRAIGSLALKIASIARKHRRNPRKSVTVALSPFVPKPHTPLQWAGQMALSDLHQRIHMVRNICRGKLSLSWNSPQIALVEAVLSLGDDGETADMLEQAVISGARFDAWTDRFRWDIWNGLLQEHVDLVDRITSVRDMEESLPWDFIKAGPSGEFLKREYRRYYLKEPTSDCRQAGCRDCGACQGIAEPVEARLPETDHSQWKSADPTTRLRIRYSKKGLSRFTSHLDMVRMWGRVVRRADLPVVYSDGYVSRPRMHFGPPLPLGLESHAEYIDIQLVTLISEETRESICCFLPEGFGIEETWLLEVCDPDPDVLLSAAAYRISRSGDRWTAAEAERITAMLRALDPVAEAEVIDRFDVSLVAGIGSRESRPDILLNRIVEEPVRIQRTDVFISTVDGFKSLREHSSSMEKKFLEG